jgi:trigger factor
MSINKVPVDGGQAKNYRVYLSEEHYIPGFNEKVQGMKKGDEREFSLDFPATHYQKHLAGKNIDIKVKAHDVFERQMPALDEAFAKALGQDSVEKLRDLLRTNLGKESATKADQQAEESQNHIRKDHPNGERRYEPQTTEKAPA